MQISSVLKRGKVKSFRVQEETEVYGEKQKDQVWNVFGSPSARGTFLRYTHTNQRLDGQKHEEKHNDQISYLLNSTQCLDFSNIFIILYLEIMNIRAIHM